MAKQKQDNTMNYDLIIAVAYCMNWDLPFISFPSSSSGVSANTSFVKVLICPLIFAKLSPNQAIFTHAKFALRIIAVLTKNILNLIHPAGMIQGQSTR